MLIVAVAVLGVVVGSYLGLVADRLPRHEPTSHGRSHCDTCGVELRWFELVPIVSWLAVRGRCRGCGVPITAVPLVVEIVTGAGYAAMAARFGWHVELAAFLVLTSALVVLSVIDLRTHRLPRQVIYIAAALGAPILVVAALIDDEPERLLWAGVGAAGAVAFFLALYLGWKGAMGDGDVRLAGLLGLFLGWIGPMHVPVGLFLGFLAGALAGVAAMARGKGGRKTMLPFGPFMAVGAFATIIWGRQLIDAWLGR